MLLRFNLDEKYRHYKKDSRFVMDLYTITYDTHEKLENLPEIHDVHKRRSTNPSMQREEIRKRLADGDGWRNPSSGQLSLNSRFSAVGGQNLQVCFMNETAGSEGEEDDQDQPQSLPCFNIGPNTQEILFDFEEQEPQDFFQKQAKLLGEAKLALSQSKEIATLQLNQEKALRPISPVSEMIGSSMSKVKGRKPDLVKGRVTPTVLKQLSSAQLQLILNDLHSHVEKLNEDLVSLLVERDDLHMEQDSMLVDIDDLTRYLAAKHNSPHQSLPLINVSQTILGKKK